MRPSTEVVEIPTGDLGFVGTASFGEEWVLPYPVAEMSAFSTVYRSVVKFLGSVTPSAGTVGSVLYQKKITPLKCRPFFIISHLPFYHFHRFVKTAAVHEELYLDGTPN